MIECKAVIFDLDGTLIDTLYDLGNSVNRALASMGFPGHEIDKYKNYIGSGTEAMVTRALPEQNRDSRTVEQCLKKFNDIYENDFNVKSRLYEDIPELLNSLTESGVKLSILTNKPYVFTEKYIESHLCDWPFEAVIGQMEGIPRKPDPSGAIKIIEMLGVERSEIVYLGDTGVDMTTAKKAGVFPVGVLWGFRDEKELVEHGAGTLINRPLELLDIIDS